MTQKVLVSGATGFVGYHTVKALVKEGFSVRLAVRNEAKLKQVYKKTDIDVSDVTGTKVVMDCAIKAGVKKIRYVSSYSVLFDKSRNVIDETALSLL